MATEDAKNTPSQEQMPDKGRRDTLKTLATAVSYTHLTLPTT